MRYPFLFSSRNRKTSLAQSTIEYLLLMTAVILVILALVQPGGLFRTSLTATINTSLKQLETMGNTIALPTVPLSGGGTGGGTTPPGGGTTPPGGGTTGGGTTGGGGTTPPGGGGGGFSLQCPCPSNPSTCC